MMAADTATQPLMNGAYTESKSIELAVDLPHSPGLRVNLRLTVLANSILLFLTSSSADAGQGAAAMGSLVYGLPDRYNPTQPLSTAIYTTPSALDFSTRLAKLLARRLARPCYVGSSINLSGAAGGGSVEEEMEAFRAIIDVVTAQVPR